MISEKEISEKINNLSEEELKRVLNIVVTGVTTVKPELERVIASTTDTRKVIEKAAEDGGHSLPGALEENNLGDRSEAMRTVLHMMAGDEEMRERIEAALETPQQLFDPITASLVLAGIVVALSTSVDISYENEDGKKKVKVQVIKPSASESILGKFFSLFSGSNQIL